MLEVYGHGGDLESAAQLYGRGVDTFLDFSANINPLGPPHEVLESLQDAVASIIRYPDPGHRKFKEILAAKLDVTTDAICVGNGAAECMALLLLALHPRKVGVIEPCFSEYRQLSEQFGAEVSAVYGNREDDWKAPVSVIEQLIQQVDLLFIGQPNNPNGVQYRLEELRTLAEAAEEYDTYIVVDEAFIDFIPEEQRQSLLSELARFPHLLFVRSMTKFYAIPGLRLGYTLANPQIVKRMQGKQVSWSVNGLALLAGEICLQLSEEYEQRTMEVISTERKVLMMGLKDLGCVVSPGEANFLLVELPHPWSAEELQRELGVRGILIRSCAMYPGLGPQYIRIAVKGYEANRVLLKEMLEVLTDRSEIGSQE
ncbi:threonine-phosphate decarboxylase [Paenibacillus sp. DS2015]|uniref:threonine-phosphate decarboxylase CobD n=1 Tax=Paenibacillus sp. DS2015 TaxID=3373917 RepID=UPI003D21602D